MAKLSFADKLRIQTLREQGLGAKAIRAAYPDKHWSLSTLQKICHRVNERGSAAERKKGSGRPKTARTEQNVEAVELLICSQEGRPGTHSSTREIAEQLGISHTSVSNIAKKDLRLKSFRRIPGQVLNATTRQKRLTRCRQLLRRCTVQKTRRLFFTDEKVFYLDPPVNSTTSKVWATGRKRDVDPQRLIRQRAKFSRSVMVSAGVCSQGKGRLHFVPEKVKINAAHYMEQLLPKLVEDCHNLLGQDFVFQQDGAPAHTAHQTQQWLAENCPDFIGKDEWPPNSPDLNPLDFCVWGMMLQQYEKHTPKPTTVAELKTVLQSIWDKLPQQPIQKAVTAFRKRLQACITASGGHFEHLLS
jgi:inhibitor of nuclear factor kappa-B kinase subunit alpha